MASSPVHATSNRNVLKYTRVVLNNALISAPAPVPLSENLLHREVFDYDFSRERVFLEISHAEIEAMKEADAKASTMAAASAAAQSAGAGDDIDTDEELAHQSKSLSVSSSGRPLKQVLRRTSSDDDVAAAISASLREY